MSNAPLKEKPLNGSAWTKPWHNYFDGWPRWVTGLISALKFTDLSDVPSSYTGQAGKVVKVKGAEDGLEFGQPDHTLLSNIGTNTHAQIDTAISNSVSHIADATIHFTENSIDHTAISNIGSNSHSTIDSHIGDSTIHFTEASIDHTAISNIGTNSHSQIDTHISDTEIHNLEFDETVYSYTGNLNTGILIKDGGATLKTITKTYDGSDRESTVSDGASTWTLNYNGSGFFTGATKV